MSRGAKRSTVPAESETRAILEASPDLRRIPLVGVTPYDVRHLAGCVIAALGVNATGHAASILEHGIECELFTLDLIIADRERRPDCAAAHFALRASRERLSLLAETAPTLAAIDAVRSTEGGAS